MARIKYYYNTQTFRYEGVKTPGFHSLLNAIGIALSMLVLAVGLALLHNMHFQTPKEQVLSNQVKELEFRYDRLYRKVESINGVLENIEHRDDNLYRVVLQAQPIEKSIRDAGIGGVDRYADIREKHVNHSALIIGLNENIDRIRRKLYIESKSQDELVQIAKEREKLRAAIPAIAPVSGKDLKVVSSRFGTRIHPIHKVRKKHDGIDFAANSGTPVYATASGTIAKIESKFTGYGKTIDIDHGFGYRTRYAHLRGFAVKEGQAVKRGDLIGYVGNTGVSTGPHLHYEVFVNNRRVDPNRYFFNDLTAAEYEQVVGLAMDEGGR